MKTANVHVKKETATALTTWEGIRFLCHFVPLLTTLAWAIYAIPNLPIWICDFVLFPMMCIGWAAALLARPLEILKLAGKLIGGGFMVGMMILIIPINLLLAVMGAGIGLIGLLCLMGLAPGAVTLYCLFKDL